jgi:hypothetical protein
MARGPFSLQYLSITIISYLLGTLTNSKPNLLHDICNLILICYNPILFVRNSNKLKTKSVARVRDDPVNGALLGSDALDDVISDVMMM